MSATNSNSIKLMSMIANWPIYFDLPANSMILDFVKIHCMYITNSNYTICHFPTLFHVLKGKLDELS